MNYALMNLDEHFVMCAILIWGYIARSFKNEQIRKQRKPLQYAEINNLSWIKAELMSGKLHQLPSSSPCYDITGRIRQGGDCEAGLLPSSVLLCTRSQERLK